MEQLGSHSTDFHEIWYLRVFRKYVEKIQLSLKSDENNSTAHEDRHTFLIISRSVLLRMRNFSDRTCTENENPHFVFGNFFENRTVYDIMWANIVQWGSPQITVWRMRIACWIPKATNTHSQYVTLIAFPPQQRLHEHASMLRYTYVVVLFVCLFVCFVYLYNSKTVL